MSAIKSLTILASIFLFACSNKQVNFESGIGFGCFAQPNWANNKAHAYLCVFELNTVSPHYSDTARMALVNKFVEKLGRECRVSSGKEMVDPKVEADHGMFLIVHHVNCN